MEIDAKITLLFSENGLTIDIYNESARTEFISIKLDEKQTCAALSRLARVECIVDVRYLERVGKKRESIRLEFEIPEDTPWDKQKEIAVEISKSICPIGWVPSTYFGSKDSFFDRDGKKYAQTTMYRWV